MSIAAKLKKAIAFPLIGALLVLVPADFTTAEGLTGNEACAGPSNGACCRSFNTICWTPGGSLYNYYYSSNGNC